MFDYELYRRLSETFGPSGYEDDVRDLICKEISPYVDELYADPMGNLIAVKGPSPKILFDAHMDEVGFMITGILDDGTLRFSQIGSVTPGTLPGKRVLVGKGLVPGVINATPTHLVNKDTNDISYDVLRINIGAETKSEAESIVSVGDGAIFDTHCNYLGVENNAIESRNADDRLGCYLLIQLIKNKKVKNAVFVFSVQEETGDRGAAAAAEEINYLYAIAVDTTSAANVPGNKAEDQVCAINNGGVLSFIDKMTTYDNEWIAKIFEHIQSKCIPIQTKGRNCGGTNASAYQKAGTGHKSLSLSTPALFIHGPLSMVTLDDIDNMEKALLEIYSFLTKESVKEGDAE